jgi:hypothetical protein
MLDLSGGEAGGAVKARLQLTSFDGCPMFGIGILATVVLSVVAARQHRRLKRSGQKLEGTCGHCPSLLWAAC